MKIIFYSKDAQFELTDEEYGKAMIVWNNNQKAFIQRLAVSLSPLYIWAGEKPENNDRKQNRDGQWCVKKFGQWVLENNQDVKVDTHYYPELVRTEEKKEIEAPSQFAKQLTNKF